MILQTRLHLFKEIVWINIVIFDQKNMNLNSKHMKLVLFPIAAVVLLNFHCKKEPTLAEIAISKVKESLPDPNSFRLIKVEQDTTWTSDVITREILVNTTFLNNLEDEVAYNTKYAETYSLSPTSKGKAEEYLAKAQSGFDSINLLQSRSAELLALIDSIKGTERDTVVNYIYGVRGYTVSSGGREIIGDWNVIYDPSYTFIQVTSVE